MEQGRKPDFVCIGAQKAGTTWLYVTLGKRPDIWFPPFKEFHFFDTKFNEECRSWTTGHVRRGLQQAKNRHLKNHAQPDPDYLSYLDRLGEKPMFNRSWYKTIFSRAPKDAFCFDVTPEYCTIGNEGIEFFKKFLPKTQIIYMIRHPYDRLVSQIKMNMSRRLKNDPDFCDWQTLLDVPALAKRGDYLNQVPQWDAHYSEDQLIYLPFGRIKTDSKKLLEQIEDHCNLPRFDYPAPSKVYHKTPPVEVPKEVLKELEDRAAPQAEFIAHRFGSDFLEQSR